jgi:FMN-dependent NADH-azoreductase
MGTLLCITSSPRGEESYSQQVAEAFVEAHQASHADDTIDRLDLWEADLPAFDRDAAAGKYAIIRGAPAEAKQIAAWQAVERVIGRFKAADKYVFAVPMWNFGIPYVLKHYVDVVVQPGYTFAFDPESGYTGLMEGRPVLGIYAAGGRYDPGSDAEAMDFQRRYLESVFRFVGLGEPKSILVQPTLHGGAPGAQQALDRAVEEAKALAPTF